MDTFVRSTLAGRSLVCCLPAQRDDPLPSAVSPSSGRVPLVASPGLPTRARAFGECSGGLATAHTPHSGVEAGTVDPRTFEDHVEQLSLRLKQGGHSEVLCPLPFYAVVVRL